MFTGILGTRANGRNQRRDLSNDLFSHGHFGGGLNADFGGNFGRGFGFSSDLGFGDPAFSNRYIQTTIITKVTIT